MTAVILVAKPVSQMQLAPGSAVTIPDVSWTEFEAILEELGHKRRARIAYSQGTLEIMVPLPEHEKPKELISDFVKTLLRYQGRRYEPFGSTTFKKLGTAGVEPDACFYIQNYQRMIGRRRLEPDDPPPDLAIQSDVTSKTKLDAYRAVGVPELWVYDNGTLNIYVLSDGIYLISDTSPLFEDIPIKQIIPTFVERAWQVGNLQALEEFEVAIAQR
ncbi:Uma2 family endonuclease [Nostoc sp. FACHB-152]|uniref:Uma2 family endonuclease n=1 Tax=unclassified Nostoc TaxID=2593658 RepID=UPI0016894E70|nr:MULTISPECIES: Uma2 family endonuclease [unclassified Nostoc]MBD2451274.1 Uma2 family endonuclease [Nostoc sp. FACHB-152]MBD2466951.1 Uma2 family endonuclease [Nostoc sp. FACHB-145]